MKSIITTFWLVFLTFFLKGQTRDKYAINPFGGIFLSGQNNFGNTFGIELNTSIDKKLFSIDYIYFQEKGFLWPDQPTEKYNQLGCYGGIYYGKGLFRLQLQAGLSAFWGYRRTDKVINVGTGWGGDTYESKGFVTIGIPLKIGFKLIPFYFLSIGLDLKANINLQKQMFSPLISIELGHLREKIR